MVDIHSHILCGIDDGSHDIDESIEIIKKAILNNVTDIILTPHYINNTIYNADNVQKEKIFHKILNRVKENKLNINLYLGNEIYIDDDIKKLLEENKCSTLNKSKYILIELSIHNKSDTIKGTVEELVNDGYIPILAHPERYSCYYKDYQFFDNLISLGCLMQANIGSLYGKYGSNSKRMLKGLLKRNMIHFMASDIHSKHSDIYDKDIQNKLLKIIKNKDVVLDILINNGKKVINNIDI